MSSVAVTLSIRSSNFSVVLVGVVVVVLAVGTVVHLTDDLLASPAAATPSPPKAATIMAIPRPIMIPLHDPILPGPAEYNVEGVIYLTPQDQEQLPYRIVSLLPWNHFGRKNIGYLYAVHHGATVCMYHIPHVGGTRPRERTGGEGGGARIGRFRELA